MRSVTMVRRPPRHAGCKQACQLGLEIRSAEHEPDLGKAGLIRIMPDRETELATHRQHRVVLVEDDAFDAADLLRLARNR